METLSARNNDLRLWQIFISQTVLRFPPLRTPLSDLQSRHSQGVPKLNNRNSSNFINQKNLKHLMFIPILCYYIIWYLLYFVPQHFDPFFPPLVLTVKTLLDYSSPIQRTWLKIAKNALKQDIKTPEYCGKR